MGAGLGVPRPALLETLENASGRTARLIEIPPLELEELRSTLGEFREDASGLPGPQELASLYRGLRAEAARRKKRKAEAKALEDLATRVGRAG